MIDLNKIIEIEYKKLNKMYNDKLIREFNLSYEIKNVREENNEIIYDLYMNIAVAPIRSTQFINNSITILPTSAIINENN